MRARPVSSHTYSKTIIVDSFVIILKHTLHYAKYSKNWIFDVGLKDSEELWRAGIVTEVEKFFEKPTEEEEKSAAAVKETIKESWKILR